MKKTLKKSMSIILSILMIISTWAFAPLAGAAGGSEPDFTEIDQALKEYNKVYTTVVPSSDVKTRINEIKDIINEIKNDPNATDIDSQNEIDAFADEVNTIVDHLNDCASGNHIFSSEWTIDIEPTCNNTGSKSHHCAYCCQTTAKPEVDADHVDIPRLEHIITNWTETKLPTCTEDGINTGVCELCGTAVTQSVSKVDHNWGSWVNTKKSTCTVNGEATRTCDRCGETQTKYFPLLEHHIVIIPSTAATCVRAGKSQGAYCDVCGQITKEQTDIPAIGHVDNDNDGVCDVCGGDFEGECSCSCHKDNIFSKLTRFIYTLLSKILRKEITCCKDMEFWS
ncbi:MAG: hypothetical protein ACI4GY_01235 [Acutalibacteraceae bacterium]